MQLNDTQTIFYSISGNATTTILNKPCTILGFQVMQENLASKSYIYDGSTLLVKNYAKDTPFIEVNRICQNDIRIVKTGQDEAHFIINYLSYERSTTTPERYNFTSGEILTNYFLFIIMVACIFGFITNRFIKKKWIYTIL